MIINDREFKEFVSAEQLKMSVADLAKKVMVDYEDKDPFYLVMMNGAFVFAADFLRHISHPVNMACVKYTSYEGMHSTGKVTAVLPIPETVKDRDVILLEDMIDSGTTMKAFLEEIKKFHPKSVAVVSMFCKPECFKNQFEIDYVGMNLPNKFVVGYGLDYDGCGRNLPALYYTE